jgi:hypothetical protein
MKKRHEIDRQKLEAWRLVLAWGDDFFGDLEPLGIIHPVHVWPPSKQRAAKRAFMKAARAAWAELGAEFMKTWTPEPDDPVPWALAKFGKP